MQLLHMIQLLSLAQGICGEQNDGSLEMSMFQPLEPVSVLPYMAEKICRRE